MLRLARHYLFCLFDTHHFGRNFVQRQRFNTAVFISPNGDYLFTKNEKAGNNTARMTLQLLAAGGILPASFRTQRRWTGPLLQPSDMAVRDIRDLNSSGLFRFAIVRNPYSRILSCYKNKIERGAGKREKFVRRAELQSTATFKDFVAAVARQEPETMDPHWRIQYYNLFCDVIEYDRFIRFEDYEGDFVATMSRFYSNINLVNVRKGQTNAAHLLDFYYTKEIADLVYDTFAIDFEYFGYERM